MAKRRSRCRETTGHVPRNAHFEQSREITQSVRASHCRPSNGYCWIPEASLLRMVHEQCADDRGARCRRRRIFPLVLVEVPHHCRRWPPQQSITCPASPSHSALSHQPRASGAGMSTETAAVQAAPRQRRSRVPDSKRPRRQLGSWGWATSQGDVASARLGCPLFL